MTRKTLLPIALALGAAASFVALAADAPARFADGILVAGNGKTLYTFDNDAAGSGKSVCNGPCAALWPPLMASATDQAAAPWAVITRDDGAKQWSYKGKPLYFYQADQKAGDRAGDNFRSIWHVIKE